MILTDEKRGILSACKEFKDDPRYSIINEVQKVEISDVLKVHDFNYIKNVIDQAKSLEKPDSENFIRYGKFPKTIIII